MTFALQHDTIRLLYLVAFLTMAAAAVLELIDTRKLTWSLLVSVSWAVVMFAWWNP